MLDLHGMLVHDAWKHFRHEVDLAYFAKKKTLRVVTGQGAIEREFPTWAENHSRVREYKQLHPGCFSVKLYRK